MIYWIFYNPFVLPLPSLKKIKSAKSFLTYIMHIKSLPTKDRHYLYCRDEGTNLLEITQFARGAAGAETLTFGYQILGHWVSLPIYFLNCS